jgi:hypothetical protein
MIEIIVIVGLPGSGKTHLASSMVDENTTLIDDLSRDPFRMEKYMRAPTQRLIITDPVVARPEHIRKRLGHWLGELKHSVEIIAFENEPEKCYRNILRREDGRVIGWEFVQRMSLQYRPELYDRVEPVFVPQ